MYHEEYNTFIQLNLLRVYISLGAEIGKGDHFWLPKSPVKFHFGS